MVGGDEGGYVVGGFVGFQRVGDGGEGTEFSREFGVIVVGELGTED